MTKRSTNKSSILLFPAYRRFEAARVETNDAMMALLIGGRLGSHALLRHGDSDRFLSEIFPTVKDIRRLDRTAAKAQRLIDHAERYFAYLAIPFALTVYKTFVLDCIELFEDTPLDPTTVQMHLLHKRIQEKAGELPSELVELFELSRQIRNRILHHNATQGSNLRPAYRALSRPARESWKNLSDQQLPLSNPKEQLALGACEITAVLAITKNLARCLNESLTSTVTRERWIKIIKEDFEATSPRAKDRNTRLRRIQGHARHFYPSLGLSREELAASYGTEV